MIETNCPEMEQERILQKREKLRKRFNSGKRDGIPEEQWIMAIKCLHHAEGYCAFIQEMSNGNPRKITNPKKLIRRYKRVKSKYEKLADVLLKRGLI